MQSIVKAEGLGGIYRGVVPVMARQGANSAVRFGVYSSLNDLVKSKLEPGSKMPATYTFGIGAIAGIITVYTTMPLDVVKTKMQGLNARQLYSGVFDCAWKVFKNEGVLSFWSGATPRLARLSVSYLCGRYMQLHLFDRWRGLFFVYISSHCCVSFFRFPCLVPFLASTLPLIRLDVWRNRVQYLRKYNDSSPSNRRRL